MVGCSTDQLTNMNTENIASSDNDINIEIKTSRMYGENLPSGISTTRANDPFTEIREVECSESIVVPELQPHIWIGNILTKNSVADCNYKPLIYPRSPITLTLTLLGANPTTIANPSYSSFMQYVQQQTTIGNFSQSNEFSCTTEQFTSYNELKAAFGSNKNTGMLFWGSSSVEDGEHHSISKATGLYVKFYQTSFKAVMDYPQAKIASIPANMLDSAVYVNSISFGRLGIMSLETNSAAEYSKVTINRVFKKLLVSGSSSLTTEEQNFLNGCDFKAYLIGGNGTTGVETFTGYYGFIQHIKKGIFSKNEPGTPIFCTFNHVKDNTPVKVNFKFNIKKSPLYVEFARKTDGLYLNFYRSRSKVPVIADPKIAFDLRRQSYNLFKDSYNDPIRGWIWILRPELVYDTKKTAYNAGYQTSLKLYPDDECPEGNSFDTSIPHQGIEIYRRAQIRLTPNENILIMGKDYYGDEKLIFPFEEYHGSFNRY